MKAVLLAAYSSGVNNKFAASRAIFPSFCLIQADFTFDALLCTALSAVIPILE
ncbi:hypothetical protein Z949_1650 [Sulfitobacter guttiformis KCTC 32187]|nr:hypothetical protein Z949_1650 [Sulfitobacter guttiformis KCTC 32187]